MSPEQEISLTSVRRKRINSLELEIIIWSSF